MGVFLPQTLEFLRTGDVVLGIYKPRANARGKYFGPFRSKRKAQPHHGTSTIFNCGLLVL